MSYANQFLSLRCSGDVLNSVFPIREPIKEISESMAIIKRVKKILTSNPGIYSIFDLCAGNCLTSSLIAHLFDIKHVFAIDKATRERKGFEKINNFSYNIVDIEKEKEILIKSIQMSKSIIISVHPCCDLAQQIVNIYKESNADYLFMIPCCHGRLLKDYPTFVDNKLSKYELWCLDLCNMMNGKGNRDKMCLSEKNIVIKASRVNDDIDEVDGEREPNKKEKENED